MDLRIPATDGLPLAATLHGEPSRARALVTVNGATAVPRGFYRAYAEHLASRGFAVLTYDYRGTGGSSPAPRDARMSDWGAKDLAGILAWAGKEHPDLPLVGVGHSAGGQLLCLAEGASRYRAFVGVAAQSGYWRHWRGAGRLRRWLDWHVVVPTVAAFVPTVPRWAGLGAEVPSGVVREWARWCRHPDYILRDEPERRRAAYAELRMPLLSWSFADDAYGPKAAVDWLAAQLTSARVERRHVDPGEVGAPIGHFGFFRPRFEATLWRGTDAWLDANLG